MAWLLTDGLPKYWHNYPANPGNAPVWQVVSSGTYGGNPYAVATSFAGYSNSPARLLTNKFSVPAEGAVITFKLYVPDDGSGAAVYTTTVQNVLTSAALTISGLTAGIGWKDCSLTLSAGTYCLEFRVSPSVYIETMPAFVLDEVVSTVNGVQANLIELGGDGYTFPPGFQVPYGWENVGLAPFEPQYEPSTWMRPTAYPGVLQLNVYEPSAGWFGELLSHSFTVPAGGITVSCTVTRDTTYASSPWSQSTAFDLIVCDAAGVPTGVTQSQVLAADETHYTLSVAVPEGDHRIRFKLRVPVTSEGASTPFFKLNLTQVTPELVANGGDALPPYEVVGWINTQEFPAGWFNAPVNEGYMYAADPPQPQWEFVGPGPYALQVVGGASVQGTVARMLTNVFSVPAGGGYLKFKFYNTAIAYSPIEFIKFLNRKEIGIGSNVYSYTPSYTAYNFNPEQTGWQDVTLRLPEGEHCIEFYVKRESWSSADTRYIIDAVSDPLIATGGLGIGFPYGYRMPPGWQNTGAVSWVLGAESDSDTGELLVHTGTSGLPVNPTDYAELLTHVFSVSSAPLSASFHLYLEFALPINPVFSVLLCDEYGEEQSTLYTKTVGKYEYLAATFEVPVGTWALRFRLAGDFTQPYTAGYLEDVAPSLLAQGGEPVGAPEVVLELASSATMANTSGWSGLFDLLTSTSAKLSGDFYGSEIAITSFLSAAHFTSSLDGRPLSVLLVQSSGVASDAFSALAELTLVILDAVPVGSFFSAPADVLETWVMNLENGGFTRYEHYDFSSFAKVGDTYYGCKSDGIYMLEGDTDSGDPIRSMVSFGKQNFGTSALKRITNAYVGVSGEGRLFLKVIAEGQEYTYAQRSYDEQLQVQRFDTGKGMRVNWLEFELYNADGEDFELASVEFAAVPLSRRI